MYAYAGRQVSDNLAAMKAGDMVYYLFTDKNGPELKFSAVVTGVESDGISIRVGRYDVQTNDVKTFESVVSESALQPRSIPWTFEAELQGKA
jgi:hypothetical protein